MEISQIQNGRWRLRRSEQGWYYGDFNRFCDLIHFLRGELAGKPYITNGWVIAPPP